MTGPELPPDGYYEPDPEPPRGHRERPHVGDVHTDTRTEEALVGYLIGGYSTGAEVAAVTAALEPDDLYSTATRTAFATIADLHRTGRPVDAVSLAAELTARGLLDVVGGQVPLIDWQTGEGRPVITRSSWRSAVDSLVRLSTLRRLRSVTRDTLDQLAEPSADPAELRDQLADGLASIGDRQLDDDAPLPDVWDWLDIASTDYQPPEWAIPGIIRRGHRAMIVGEEGAGKTVMIRQMIMAASAGLHPFATTDARRIRRLAIPPVRTLAVDLENPLDQLSAVGRMIVQSIRGEGIDTEGPDLRGQAMVLTRPGGMDLRTRVDRNTLERAIARHRPDIVAIGPVYKAYIARRGESDEQAVAELQAILDDLRTRYGFALVLEHHAPKASGTGAARAMSPYGSSLWLRWPELGRSLIIEESNLEMRVGKWRGDRVTVTWPEYISRGKAWPFEASYSTMDDPAPGIAHTTPGGTGGHLTEPF